MPLSYATILFLIALTRAKDIVDLPPESAYLLPLPPGPSATTNNANNSTLPYLSYDPSFGALIAGPPLLVAEGTGDFAYEAGAWDPDRNEVWFTSVLQLPPNVSHASVLRLNNNTVFRPTFTSKDAKTVPLLNPNGGYYFNGSIYIAIAGSNSTGGAVVQVNPDTYVVTELLNSFYGLPLVR